jgi:hypothetical protein
MSHSDSPLSPEAAHMAERIATALALRVEGHSFRAIAKLMLCSVSSAHGYIRLALEERRTTIAMLTEELIEIESERLDAMQHALKGKIESGDTQAINTALSVMARRAKMLGLDQPDKIAHTGSPSAIEAAAIAKEVFGSPSALTPSEQTPTSA